MQQKLMEMIVDKMPEYKENHVTLWRNGNWVQVNTQDMSKIIEEDNREPENNADLPAGE